MLEYVGTEHWNNMELDVWDSDRIVLEVLSNNPRIRTAVTSGANGKHWKRCAMCPCKLYYKIGTITGSLLWNFHQILPHALFFSLEIPSKRVRVSEVSLKSLLNVLINFAQSQTVTSVTTSYIEPIYCMALIDFLCLCHVLWHSTEIPHCAPTRILKS